jgi:hypothetical protein
MGKKILSPPSIVRCYLERFENFENPFGTSWEQKKSKKNPPPLLPKTIKLDPSCVHAESLIGCMELLFPELFVPIFGLG